jgi:flavin reductase (DIM6/NTAB) family NADH-FMN oxidoreductase RutF
MQVYTSEEILSLDQRFRANLFQSLLGPKSTFLIGSTDEHGIDNLAIFNNLIHIGANPPLYGIQFRPDGEVRRDTLHNIKHSGYFTLNSITPEMVIRAHQSSAKYDASLDEFEVLGFLKTPSVMAVPYVSESPIKLLLKYDQTLLIQNSDVKIVLGQIIEIVLLNQPQIDGFVNPIENKTVTSVGLDAYYQLDSLLRLSYAKPGFWPKVL